MQILLYNDVPIEIEKQAARVIVARAGRHGRRECLGVAGVAPFVKLKFHWGSFLVYSRCHEDVANMSRGNRARRT